MKQHKMPMLKARVPVNGSPLEESPRRGRFDTDKTLRDKQKANGRTLALNGLAWRKLRARVLSERPLCEACSKRGRVTPATDVDHNDNDPTNNDRDNLVSLCHPCHSRKTQADMGKQIKYGCDTNGMPLDPDHHWNA